MKTRQPLEVVRDSIEAFNERDWDRFSALLAPNAVYDEVGTGRKLKGRKEITSVARGWTEAFPDVEGTIDEETVEKDTVVVQVTYRGTHDGDLPTPGGTIPPSGESIITRCAEVHRVEDGLIVENRNFFDMLSMLQAVGAIPAAAAKKAGA